LLLVRLSEKRDSNSATAKICDFATVARMHAKLT